MPVLETGAPAFAMRDIIRRFKEAKMFNCSCLMSWLALPTGRSIEEAASNALGTHLMGERVTAF